MAGPNQLIHTSLNNMNIVTDLTGDNLSVRDATLMNMYTPETEYFPN